MSKQKDRNTSVLVCPMKGYDVGSALAALGQPPLTTGVLSNVFPFDGNGRTAMAVRPELLQPFYSSGSAGGVSHGYMPGGNVKALAQVTISVPSAATFETLILVDNAGGVYCVPPTTVEVKLGTGTVNINTRASIASNATTIYFADGSAALRYIDGTLLPGASYVAVVATVIPSAGSLPTGCTIARFWRARLLLSGGGPILYASKVGDPTDWDFAGDLDAANPGDAWSISMARSAQAGEEVTALMPFSDDTILVGCTNSLYRIDGDPAAGGEVTLVSSSAGVSGPNAWCSDGAGTIYYVGALGLYAAAAGSAPKLISDGLGKYFLQVASVGLQLNFDTQNNGVWIIDALPLNFPVVYLYYDIRLDAFFPFTVSTASRAATSAWSTIGNFPGLLLGGVTQSGGARVRLINPALGPGLTDNENISGEEEAIVSKMLLGPFQPEGDFGRAKIISLIMVTGDHRDVSRTIDTGNRSNTLFNINYTLIGGNDPSAIEAIDAGNATQTGVLSSYGRQPPANHRMSASSFGVLISNSTIGKTWSFDRVIIQHVPAGRNR